MKPKPPIWGVVMRDSHYAIIHYESGLELERKFWFNPRDQDETNMQQINAAMYLLGFVDCLRGAAEWFKGFTV